MPRHNDARNKNKGVLGEGSSGSRRQTPPHSPESGHLVQIPASEQNAYPFTARMRMTTSMKEREAKLKNMKVINPIYPDCDLLSSLGLLDELSSYFVENGFGFMFGVDPPLVYEAMVREFIYSFKPEWRMIPRDDSRNSIPEKCMMVWKFRLGGVVYNYSREDLLRAFDLRDFTSYPYVRKSALNEFWKRITGSDEDFAPAEQSTKIVNPVWRLVHRFIATGVVLRKDEGRWVTKTDLELMYCFEEEQHFDALVPITKSLEESTTTTFRGTYLGGGHFVTLIAKDIGLVLDPQFAMPRRVLGEAEMVRRGFLKLERDFRGIHRSLVGRDTSTRARAQPPPQPQQGAATSSAPHQPITLEDLSAQLHTLSVYHQDNFRWAGEMFSGLYSRMGYDGYVPPPHNPFMSAPASDPMEGTSGAGDAMEEEGDDDDEDDSGDDSGDEEEMDEDTEGSFSI